MSNTNDVAALVTATNHLTQTVVNTRSEIVNTVTAKIAELDAWKAALAPSDAKAEPRYHSVIDLTGLPTDRFYPVWWWSKQANGTQTLTFARNYADDKHLNPFGLGVTHLAGLTLEIEQIGNVWSGAANFLQVVRLSQTYRNTVRQIRFAMKCASVGPVPGHSLGAWANSPDCPAKSGLYLRGGLTYQVFGNQPPDHLVYSREYGAAEVYSEVRSGGALGSGRWLAQSYPLDDPFLGPDYDDFKTPYNAFPYTV